MMCYNCKKEIKNGTTCDNCGAIKKLNAGGNPVWMLNGRIISAPVEEKEAYDKRIRNYPKTKNIVREGEEEYARKR